MSIEASFFLEGISKVCFTRKAQDRAASIVPEETGDALTLTLSQRDRELWKHPLRLNTALRSPFLDP